MRVEVEIGRIVVDGFDVTPERSSDIRDAIVAQLTKLIAGTPRSAWSESRTLRLARSGMLPVTNRNPIGVAAGHAVHGAVLRTGRP